MEIRPLKIEGLVELTPRLFRDERGFFFESYNKKTLKDAGLDLDFVQDNQSYSTPGVVRGLHFQKPPFAQGKLVRVLKGKILDVAVDIRKGSPTFGQYEAIVLDDIKCNMLWIPAGFAHGFSALEESMVMYKCTNIYDKASESGIIWNDPQIAIDWLVAHPNVSDKDKELKGINELDFYF
ncbi:MAG: dTDP-4-dehydrorhamnose 3,5-epimerase [Cytophagales bacterium]|nr:MAG: dTDP-4-dehydrorhamnose 3,5-epimerase [Cytophagales bacterium]